MDIALLESFALSEDRAAALARLVPGTEEHAFLQCLLHQQRGELAEARKLLDGWAHGHEIRQQLGKRQVLLEADPQGPGWDALKQGLRFDHRCQLPGKTPPRPTRLPPTLLARSNVLRQTLSRGAPGVDALSQREVRRLFDDPELTGAVRRRALERLTRPRPARLLDHVVAELGSRPAKSFGNLAIHRQLTLAQLDALAARVPDVLQSEAYVDSVLQLLAIDPEGPADEEGRLERQIAFSERLPASFAMHRASLLYQRISLRWRRGEADREGLRRYLGLTAPAGSEARSRDTLATRGHSEALLLAVLRACLVEGADDLKGLLSSGLLRRQQAEAMLLAGAAEPARWAAHLEPAQLRALQERVDLELAPGNPSRLGADDEVELLLDAKNVPSLVIRIFHIDTVSHYRAHGGDVDLDLDLDGFVPNHERVLPLAPPPMVRHRVRVALPEAKAPGTYVIDLVGGGLSCRALLRKGHLRAVERVGAAGHALTVLDERGRPVPDATAWLGDRAFEADDQGTITIPFTTSPETRTLLLQRGDVTGLQSVALRGESYQLEASFHVEQEDLLPGAEARLLIRARLLAAGGAASPALLDRLRLTVAGTREGITSERVYDGLRLDGQGELLVGFTVPESLESLQFTLSGELLDTRGSRVTVTASGQHQSGEFRSSGRITSLHLLDEPEGWSLLLLGRAGEPVPGAPISVTLFHRLSSGPISTTLQTDDDGKVALGPLPDVTRLSAEQTGGEASRTWNLHRFTCRYPAALHLAAGEALRLPLDEPDEAAGADASGGACLFSRVGDRLVHDLSDQVKVSDGALTIEGLAPGDYDLDLPGAERTITLRVARGRRVGGWLDDGARLLGPAPRAPAALSLQRDGAHLRVRVQGGSPRARVHLFATTLAQPTPELPAEPLARAALVTPADAPNLYASARTLGDEASYILARRHAPRRAGNMLPRPSLLLNPWAVNETSSADERLRAGDRFKSASRGGPGGGGYGAGAPAAAYDLEAEDSAPALDFLPRPALVLHNLRPDEDGLITIPLAALEGRGVVRALLLDDDTHLTRQLAVTPTELRPRDRRVRSPLHPEVPYALRGEVTLLAPGDSLTLGDARYRVYDTLGKAWDLLDSLDPARRCTRFDFLRTWGTLDDDQKQKHYSDSACHELSFFLYRKDRPFFDRVIAPYLAHKRHLTFLDQYLLGRDLSAYRAPSARAQLNALERVLLAERTGELHEEHRAQRDRMSARGPDHATRERLFRAALQADALSEEPKPAEPQERELHSLILGGAEQQRSEAKGGAPRAARAPAKKERHKMAKRDVSFDEEADEEESEGGEVYQDMLSDEVTRDVGRRAANKPLYQPLDRTREYAEQHYHRQRSPSRGLEAPPNLFWSDYAAHRGAGPFLSPHFVHCTDGSASLLLALAVLDLPVTASHHALDRDAQGQLTLRAASPAIVFHEQLKPALAGNPGLLMVAQHYLRADPSGQRRPVLGELLVRQPYTCQVIASNPSPYERQLDLLLQLPEGTLPLNGSRVTRSERLRLGAFETRTLDYTFYFPHPGDFRHHPAQASEDGQALAAAPAATLHVALTPSTIDHDAWPHLSQAGTDDEVLAALDARNLHTLQLDQIAWRLHDRGFYDRALALLERRHHYDATAWSYALLHRDLPRAAEFWRQQPGSPSALAIELPWFSFDPEDAGVYEHLEYAPLVNPRAHGPAGAQKILNHRLRAQVERLLTYLCSKRAPDDDDRLSFVYYLLLQDRIDEAASLFESVDPARVRARLQHDYARAYLAFFQQPAQARAVAAAHVDHPVDRWRDRFREVVAQLDEIEGKVTVPTDLADRDQRQGHLVATAPSLELQATSAGLRLLHRHAPGCRVNFYEMDLELLFSQRPFGLQAFRERPPLRANVTAELTPGHGEGALDIAIPASLRGRPLLVEVTSGEARATAAYTAGALAVQLTESYGQLRVTHLDTGAPLPRVYVKVYAQDGSGHERFHKDGYTDLRGRFDYASVSGDAPPPRRFALLLLSDDHGAALREAAAPTR